MIEIRDKNLSGITFIDLFCGLGGFRLALESLGATCVFSCEINSEVASVYEHNFGDYPLGDITKINENDVPEHDILCAGFPCQPFSASGKKMGFEDTHGTLFFDIARIIEHRHPKVVFLENVMYLVEHDNGRTMSVIKTTLENLGYNFNYQVLNALNYGVAQQRKRTYIVCFRKDLDSSSFHFPYKRPLYSCIMDIMVDEELTKDLRITRDIYPPNRKPKTERTDVILYGFFNSGRQGERVYSIEGACITIATFNKEIIHYFNKDGEEVVRRLHNRECARLMGLPDSYILHTNKFTAHRQIGNSVVVDVIQYIGQEIGKCLSGEDYDELVLCNF